MSAQRWTWNLRLLWASQFLVTAGLTVIVPLLPFYMEQLGLTDPAANRLWSGLALAAPAIPLMLAAPLWGRLGDRYGRKVMVVRALFGIAVSVLLMGFARSPLAFVICRMLQGAFGGVDDAAAAFAGSQAPPEVRGRALGYLQTSTAAGALVGPLLGGFLSGRFGFAPLILVTGILIGAAGLLSAWGLHETQREPAAQQPAGVPLRHAVRAVLGQRTVRAFILAGLCVQIGTYGIVTVFATHVRSILTQPEAASAWVGTLQACTWAATLLGAAWWGRLNDRRPSEHNFIIAAVGCALSIALQALPGNVLWLLPLRIAQGFCLSALGQTIYLRASRAAGAEQQGVFIGVANSFLTLGQVVGSLAAAAIAGLVTAPGTFVVMGGMLGIGAIIVWGAGRTSAMPALRTGSEQQRIGVQ